MEPNTTILTNAATLGSARRVVPFREDLSGYALILASICLAQLGLFFQPQLGAYLTAGTLALLMLLAAKYDRVRNVVLASAIIPLLGMINLTFIQQSAFEQTAVLYGAMLVLSVVYRIILRQRTPAHRVPVIRPQYATFLFAAVIFGSLLGVLSYKLLSTSYVFGGVPVAKVLILAIFGAVSEESFFRGLIQRQASVAMPRTIAVWYTALLYITLSLSHFTPWSIAAGLISTITLSFFYRRFPNLWLTTILNCTSKLVYLALIAKYVIG
jgi:membrane protease YdiL (CAAX protease family)